MAKKSTALAHAVHHAGGQGRVLQPIVVRASSGGTRRSKKPHHRRHGQSSQKVLMGLIVGGFVMGFVDKQGSQPGGFAIPTIPVLGRAGTIAVAAHFFGKGKHGIVTDVRNAAAVVAAYEFGLKGSVSGEGEV